MGFDIRKNGEGFYKIMRILIATGIYPPDVGGPATHVQRLASAFKERGMDVQVLTYGSSEGMGVESVSRIIPPGLRHLVYFWNCLRSAWASDLVYAQDATAAGLPAFFAAKIFGKKFFLRIGGDILWERLAESGKAFLSLKECYAGSLHLKDHPILFRLIKFVLQNAERIIVPTPLLKDLYTNFYGINPENIQVICNPVSCSPNPGRKKEPKGTDELTILFAGRFVAYKNLPFLIKVFDKVRQRLGRGKLLLIGDGPEKSALEKLKTQLASAAYIEIRPVISRENLVKEIQEASICIGPAVTEFNPNFILECISLSKPVLLTRENGLTVNLPEDFLFNPKSEEELEKKIENLFESKFYRQSAKTVKRNLVEQTWATVVNEHLKIFNRS